MMMVKNSYTMKGKRLIVDASVLSLGMFDNGSEANQDAVSMVNALRAKGVIVWIICTNTDVLPQDIAAWMNGNGVEWHTILARDEGDIRASNIVKKEWIEQCQLHPKTTFAVLEKSYSCAVLWWSKGFPCYHSGP